MLAKSHTMMALVAIAPIASYAPLWALPYLMAGALLGSLFPDIDEPQSTIGRYTAIVSIFLSLFVKHRGITHTVGAILLYASVGFLAYLFIAKSWVIWATSAFIVGNIVHVIGDMLTSSGVEILNPITTRKFYLLPRNMRFKTGGAIERFALLPILSLCVAFIYIDKTVPLLKGLSGIHG